jgi:hypothetical protein
MDDIIDSYRELALRMSVDSIEPNTTGQTVPYTSRLASVQYAANRGNLVLAVIVSLIGPIATFALFWGWWELGRPFSLSPLEVANAFRPSSTKEMPAERHRYAVDVLEKCSGNASAGDVVRHVLDGERNDPLVRYGVSDDSNRLSLVLVESRVARRPRAGELL